MFVEHERFFREPLNILVFTNMVSFVDNKNSFTLPFGAWVWLVCSVIAWGSYLLKYDLGVVGYITWGVSLVGIATFLLTCFAWVVNRFG